MLDNSYPNGKHFLDSQMLTLSFQVTNGTLDSCNCISGLYKSNPTGNTKD